MRKGRALAALAGLAAGCGGVAEVGDSPSWRGPGDETEEAERGAASAAPGPVQGGEPEELAIEVDDSTAEFYNAPEPAPPGESARSEAVGASLEGAAERADASVPRRDGRLDRASERLAEVAPAEAPLPYPLIEFALQSEGIVEPSPHLIVLWGPRGDVTHLEDELESRLPGILETAAFSRVGVGAAERGGSVVTVIALQASHLETEPIPRVLPGGGEIRVEGRVREPFAHPEVYVTREDGSVTTAPLRREGSTGFRTDVACGADGGRNQIEILARDRSGSTVLANFPVWCGESPPRRAEVPNPAVQPAPESAGRAEEELARLINRERERHGLEPLGIDSRVADVARGHAEEMADTGMVAHISPETGSASDRVRAAEIETPLVLENVARAYSVREAHEGLMNSPGHRASILHEGITHVGVGVALGERVGEHREVFVGQVFTRRGEAPGARASTERLHGAVRAAGALVADPGLASVAQDYARALAGGASEEKAAAAARRRLGERAARFSSVHSVAQIVPHVGRVSVDGAVEAADATHFGVGVVPTGEIEPDRDFAVVLLFAQRE